MHIYLRLITNVPNPDLPHSTAIPTPVAETHNLLSLNCITCLAWYSCKGPVAYMWLNSPIHNTYINSYSMYQDRCLSGPVPCVFSLFGQQSLLAILFGVTLVFPCYLRLCISLSFCSLSPVCSVFPVLVSLDVWPFFVLDCPHLYLVALSPDWLIGSGFHLSFV